MSTNVALRLSYQVPELSKGGKVMGFRLEHVGLANLISAEDFETLLDFSVEKLLEMVEGKAGGAARIAKKFNLTPEQATWIRYTGVSILRHDHEERLSVSDPRWT